MRSNHGKAVIVVMLLLLALPAAALEWGYYRNQEPIFLGEFEGEEYLALPSDTEILRYDLESETVESGLLNLTLVARGDDGDRVLGRVGIRLAYDEYGNIEGTLNPDTGRIYLFGGIPNRCSLWELELHSGKLKELLSDVSYITSFDEEWLRTTELRVFSEDMLCKPEEYGFLANTVMPWVPYSLSPTILDCTGYYQRYFRFDPRTGDIEPLWSIEATSYLVDDAANCSPASAIDGDIGTAWVEGVDGPGIGESLTLNLGVPTDIWSIGLLPGYFASPDLLAANNRLKKVQITLSDGTSLTKEVWDGARVMFTIFDDNHLVDWVRVTILEVYPGTRWDDTAISEITINYIDQGY